MLGSRTLPCSLAAPRCCSALAHVCPKPLARSAGPPARLGNATPRQRRSRRGVPLLTAASSTKYASTALGRLRTAEVLGVVILDAGLRSSESDEILLDFAAAYGHAYKREVVSVASPATLERAVRGCTDEGASKIMVVPYLLSSGRNSGTDLPSALADVQLKMPGIRCIIGETIDIQSLLAQQIENSVKAVDATAPEPAPERYWRPEAAMGQDSSYSNGRDAAEALPIAEQRAWSEAVQGEQPQPRSPSPAQQAQQAHTQTTAAQQSPITVATSHLNATADKQSTQPSGQPGSQPAASAGAAAATATATTNAAANTTITINLTTAANATVVASSFEAETAQPAPAAAAAAPAPAAPSVMSSWSDDFTVVMSSGVTVNDYRSAPAQAPARAQQQQQQQQQTVAAATAATVAAATVMQANAQAHAASSGSTTASASASSASSSSSSSSSASATTQSSPEPQQASVFREAQEAPTLAASAMTIDAEWDAPVASSAPATSAPATSAPATSAQAPSSRKAATATSRPMRSTWDRTTSRLVALSAIPSLFLSLPLLMSRTATLALGAAGWAALPASLIGVCSSALLFSFHSSRGEVTAAAVQGQGLMIGLAAIAQMCIGGSLPASVLASLAVLVGVQAVVFASPTLSERLSSSAEGRWLQGAWTRAVGTLGVATAAQALWPAVQARLSTLPETQLALVTGSAALAAVATAGGSGLPPSARRSAWPAAAFFLLQPASLALTMSAVSPSVAGLAMMASALTIPRALWTNNQLWVAGSVWGTTLGFGQLMVSTGVGLHMPLLAGFAATLAGGCALANYCSFRERLASQAL